MSDGITEVLKNSHMMQTPFGNYWDPLKPETLKLCIKECAVTLARIRRYNGRGPSVAAHQVVCARMAAKHGPITQMLALNHDDPEAVITDLPAPLKEVVKIGEWTWNEYEAIVQRKVLIDLTGLDPLAYPEEMDQVNEIDLYVRQFEKMDQCRATPQAIAEYYRLMPVYPEAEFLELFEQLKTELYASSWPVRDVA